MNHPEENKKLKKNIKKLIKENKKLKAQLKNSYVIGDNFQDTIIEECITRKYPYTDLRHQDLPYDLMIFVERVQLKSSTIVENRGDIRTNHSPYPCDAFDILIFQRHDGSLYIVPESELHDEKTPGRLKKSIAFNQYEQYKNAWGIFDGMEFPKSTRRIRQELFPVQ